MNKKIETEKAKFKIINFEINGITPLLMDKYTGKEGKTPEEWKKLAKDKVYTTDDGYLCIPGKHIKACLREAGNDLAKKQSRYSGPDMRQTIKAALSIIPENLIIIPKRKKDGINRIKEDLVTRGTGVNRTRVMTYRPMLDEWSVSGTISVLENIGKILTDMLLSEAMALGGLKYGLMGYRPEYGKFEVTKFEVV